MAQMLQLVEITDHLDEATFWDLVGRLEHEQLDFKQAPPSDLTAKIAAMAMTDGGFIILGVSDDRRIVGCPLKQVTFDRIMKAAHACSVDVQLKEVRVSRHQLTVIAIPEVRGRIVTTPDGRLLRRVGSDCQPLVGDALARFVRERENRSAEDEPLPIFEPGDIDLALVNEVLRREGRQPVRRDRVMRALVDLGVASPPNPPTGPQPIAAAAVLFTVDPTKYVHGAAVQLVRRDGVGPGPGPTRDRTDVRGPVTECLENVLAFIAKHTARYEAVIGTHREVLPEYPTEVLREALLNALAHRDYGLIGATIDVTIWDDRIEIHSPGPLPGHITVENMRHEHYSRNRRIMQVLKVLGLVEEYGEGVDRMFGAMEARLMEPPVFVATESSVTVTLYNRFLVGVEDQAWLALLGHVELSPAERRVLVATRREQAITPRRVRQLLPSADADALLTSAVAKGLLVRVGHKGGARYLLSDEVVLRAGATGLEAQSRKRQMLLDEIRRRGSLSTAEGADWLDEDAGIVRHLLNDLVRAGAVVARGRTRARRYFPS